MLTFKHIAKILSVKVFVYSELSDDSIIFLRHHKNYLNLDSFLGQQELCRQYALRLNLDLAAKSQDID